jgi:hypothetical protein
MDVTWHQSGEPSARTRQVSSVKPGSLCAHSRSCQKRQSLWWSGWAVELGHEQHGALALGQGDGGRQLGPGALAAALYLDVIGHAHGLGREEAVHGGLLGFEAQAGLALAGGAHAEVGDVLAHRGRSYRPI